MTRAGHPQHGGGPERLGLTGADDDFLLHRTRLYVNAELGSRVRFYGEMLDAVSNYEDYKPRVIEENRTEMQNLFLDFVVLDPEAVERQTDRSRRPPGTGVRFSAVDFAFGLGQYPPHVRRRQTDLAR